MRKTIIYNLLYAVSLLGLFFSACSAYLDAKPDDSMILPNGLPQLQALMDNQQFMNISTGLGLWQSDDHYLTDENWANNYTEWWKETYYWNNHTDFSDMDAYDGQWGIMYRIVNFSNTVLTNIDDVEQTVANQADWNHVKGTALFHRARAFFEIAGLWAAVYNPETADTDPGIPIRLDTDFNQLSKRGTVQQVYEQIIADLSNAVQLLPDRSQHPVRPSKAAAYGMLARVYLAMRKYPEAGQAADQTLGLNSALIDFNELDAGANYPIPPFNPEVIFYATSYIPDYLMQVDTLLYTLYEEEDLRKVILFNAINQKTVLFKGSYTNRQPLFTGLATDEIHLIRAEAAVRTGDVTSGLADLNRLLISRWKSDSYIPFYSENTAAVLDRILTERRKELIFRGTRWSDLRRLNAEGKNITLHRQLNGNTHILTAQDPRWTLLIPKDIIDITGMSQNPR